MARIELKQRESDGDILVIEADGELDAQTAETFTRKVEQIVSGGVKQLIVDCTLLDAVSSAGVSAIMFLHRRMQQRGGDVKLAGVKGLVRDVLRVMRLDRVLAIYDTVADARRAFIETPDPSDTGPGE